MMDISFMLNGDRVSARVAPVLPAVKLLRQTFGLTGTKPGCGEGECGACTILLDGEAVNACLVPAGVLDGREVVTLEGLLGADGSLHPVQRDKSTKRGCCCNSTPSEPVSSSRWLMRVLVQMRTFGWRASSSIRVLTRYNGSAPLDFFPRYGAVSIRCTSVPASARSSAAWSPAGLPPTMRVPLVTNLSPPGRYINPNIA